MPYPPPRIPSGPRRRTLLACATGAALSAGCSSGAGGSGGSGDEERSRTGPSAGERARARAARDSVALLQRYDAVLVAHPTLAERLAPLRAEVARHVEAFGAAQEQSSSASPSTSPSASGSASPSAATVPADEKTALAGLAAAERTLADSRITALLDVPGELARLLASVAAAGAGHAYLLAEGAR